MPSQSVREQRRKAREERKRRQRMIYTIVLIVAVVIIGLLAFQIINVNNQKNASATATSVALALTQTAAPTTPPAMLFPGVITDTVKTASGLQYKDLNVGNGATAQSGNTVSVHYTGWLTNGTQFDSSIPRNQPFEFTLGAGNVIKGWDEGVAGMKVGGTRILIIPPDLGYGAQGSGSTIPPNSTLVFEVQLISVK